MSTENSTDGEIISIEATNFPWVKRVKYRRPDGSVFTKNIIGVARKSYTAEVTDKGFTPEQATQVLAGQQIKFGGVEVTGTGSNNANKVDIPFLQRGRPPALGDSTQGKK